MTGELVPAGVSSSTFNALTRASRSTLEHVPIPPINELVTAERALLDAMTPCDEPQAAVANARSLLGLYPNARADDPKTYVRGIAGALGMFPRAVQGAAINGVTLKCKYTPTRAEVYAECEAIMARLRVAHRMALMLMDEQRRRDERRANLARIEAERTEFLKLHGNKSPLQVLREKGTLGLQQEKTHGKSRNAHDDQAGHADRRGRREHHHDGGEEG